MTTTLNTDEVKEVHWDYETALGLLKRAVEEKGADYAPSTQCVYFDTRTGGPACIVGHAFSYVGITPADLGVSDVRPYSDGANGSGIYFLTDREHIPLRLSLEPKAQVLLDHAQSLQDSNIPWGEALDRAVEKAEQVGD